MANSYDYGDLVLFTGDFTDADGDYQDPDNVYFQIKTPSGVTTSYHFGEDEEVNKISTGRYSIELSVNASGYWKYRWYSTGVGQAAEENSIYVEPSEFS